MDLSARINEILRAHRLVSAGPARIRCKCGDGLDGRDAYLAYDAHAAALILAAIKPDIEKVAEAICVADGRMFWNAEGHGMERNHYRNVARAAVSAMGIEEK